MTYYVKKFLDRAKSRDERRALKSVSHKPSLWELTWV